jgi:pyridoxine kinase
MNILSIQSEVVLGHVGQGAARFALQRLGHEVWALPTVLYSNHSGYPHVEGDTISVDLLRRLLEGLRVNGWFERCDAVLSGYLGCAEQAELIAEAVLRAKQANPKAIYCLDPVLGDNGRVYAKAGVAEAMARHLLPLADIVTPNAFELQQLSALTIADHAQAIRAAERLGRPLVLVTSVPQGTDRIGVLAISRDERWVASTPLLPEAPHGAGDLFAALFLAEQLNGSSMTDALKRSVTRVFRILAASRGSEELRLIGEQHAIGDSRELSELLLEHL